jgi:hypothetical protein
MSATKDEAPSGRGKGLQGDHKKLRSNSTRQARFVGTNNPLYLRAIHALLNSPQSQDAIDSLAGCGNGSALISALRELGLTAEKLPCVRIEFIDSDGNPCNPDVYSLTEKARRMSKAWMRRRAGADHA